MNDEEFLRRIFDGYVNCYRQFNWHTSSNYCDMTAAELNFFAELGSHLGYFVGREMFWEYPRDLCWCEEPPIHGQNNAKYVLYLERENEDGRVISNTITKMLDPKNGACIPYLVAVLGWVRPDTLERAKALVREKLGKDQSFLCISWVGQSKNGEFTVEGWLAPLNGGAERTRLAEPKIDDAGYWYLKPSKGWL